MTSCESPLGSGKPQSRPYSKRAVQPNCAVQNKGKGLSASGGFGPWLPTRGSPPWTLLGAPPPDPVIGSGAHARSVHCAVQNFP